MEQVTPNQKNQQKQKQQKPKQFIPHDEYLELICLLASNQLVIDNLNTADDGSQFTDECMYIEDPETDEQLFQLSEKYQDQYNVLYDQMEAYINGIGIYSEWYRDNQIDSQE